MREHPLKLHHDIARQTVCWLLGHRWVSSWHRVSDRASKRRDRMTGNPYCENVSSWHYKCRRCRSRTRGDFREPWYRDLWRAVASFGNCFGIAFECYWKDGDWLVRLMLPVAGVAFGVEQGWAQWCHRGWPFWPTEAAGEISHRLATWIESRKPKPPPEKRAKHWVIDDSPPQTFTAGSGGINTVNIRWVA